MGLFALAVTAALGSASPDMAASMSCGFPAETGGDLGISVEIRSAPSLRDANGVYRVRMALNGRFELLATAQPLALSDGPAVLIGGSAAEQLHYTIGLRRNGIAALTITDAASGGEVTRMGTCRDHERYMRLWLP